MSLAVLGTIVFQASADLLLTFRDAKRSGTARWHEHDVHLGAPRSEFLGPGLDEVSFAVRLDIAHGVVPRDELRQMRSVRDTGEVLQFTIGGELVGDFSLRTLVENWSTFDARGVLRIADVTLTLKEYF